MGVWGQKGQANFRQFWAKMAKMVKIIKKHLEHFFHLSEFSITEMFQEKVMNGLRERLGLTDKWLSDIARHTKFRSNLGQFWSKWVIFNLS